MQSQEKGILMIDSEMDGFVAEAIKAANESKKQNRISLLKLRIQCSKELQMARASRKMTRKC